MPLGLQLKLIPGTVGSVSGQCGMFEHKCRTMHLVCSGRSVVSAVAFPSSDSSVLYRFDISLAPKSWHALHQHKYKDEQHEGLHVHNVPGLKQWCYTLHCIRSCLQHDVEAS